MLGVDREADEANDIVEGDVSQAGGWQDHAAGSDLVVNTAALVNNTAPWDEC